MTKEQVLRAILRKRGYIVIWQGPFHLTLSIGRRITELGGECIKLGTFAIRKRTSKADFLAQQVLSRKLEPKLWEGCSPSAMVREWPKKVGGATFWRVTPTRAKQIAG